MVTLDGSESHDPEGDLLNYAWTQLDGPPVVLSDKFSVSPTFLGKKWGDYVFQLVVNDGLAYSLPDEVVITIRNVRPAADAGPDREVLAGTRVVLNGSRSADPNGDQLTFSWRQISGPEVVLEGATSASASFVPEQVGVYVLQLVTSDGDHLSPPDEVQVIVNTPENHVPRADAGVDQTAVVGDLVTLDGSGSRDADGDSLSYAWSQVKGPRTVVLEGASTVQARFKAAVVGQYRFRLVVNDGEVSSPPDFVTVLVEREGNRAPVAVILATSPVSVGDWVQLDGSESYDPDGIGYLAYSWSQTGGPQVTLEHADKSVAGFYALTEGTLGFELVVDDGEDESAAASIEMQVIDGPLDPTQPRRQAASDDGGGCSVGLGGSAGHEIRGTDIGYVLTLFLPALGALWYQRRRCRKRG